MNSQYPALFSANWTRPAYYLPRWFDINGVPDLTDDPDLPVEDSAVEPTLESGSYNQVPALWTVSDTQLSTNPSILAAVLESVSYELEASRISSLQVEREIGASIETTQPGHLWICQTNSLTVSGFRPVSSVTKLVEVQLSDDSFVTVAPADSFHSLLYAGQWRWFYEKPYLCIFGPGLTQAQTAESSGWSFVNDQTLWDRSSVLYVQHEITGRWVPLHPDEVRGDGMIGVRDGPYQLRMVRPNSQSVLDDLIVRIDGQLNTAERVMIANSLDNSMTVNGLLRKPDDFLGELKDRMAAYHAVSRNQTAASVQARLAISFGGYTDSTLSSGILTAVTYPSGYNYSIVPEVALNDIWVETLVPTSGAVAFLTTVASADIWQAYENNVVQAMGVSGYYCFFDYDINLLVDRPEVLWLITNYRNTNGQFVPTVNFPATRPLQILYTRDVSVPDPSNDSKDEALKLSYLVRWKSQAVASESPVIELTGQAKFL